MRSHGTFSMKVKCPAPPSAPPPQPSAADPPGVAAAAGVFYNYSGGLACFDPGFGPNPESDEDLNGWDYQWWGSGAWRGSAEGGGAGVFVCVGGAQGQGQWRAGGCRLEGSLVPVHAAPFNGRGRCSALSWPRATAAARRSQVHRDADARLQGWA